MKVYFWKRDGVVFHYAAESEAEAMRISQKLDGFTTEPEAEATEQEFTAAGSIAYINFAGEIILGLSPAEQEKKAKAQRREEILKSLDEIDVKSVRPARAVATALASGQTPTAGDVQKLNQWEAQANELREELAAL